MSDLSTVDVAVSPVDKFREYLATKGKRLTRERAMIVEAVFLSHEHFDAEELVDRMNHDREYKVSRSTVYRTLGALAEAGLLRKVARPNGREVYEHDYGYPQHDHMICEKCGTLIEFQNDGISEILEQVAANHGFRISGHRLEVYGLCSDCCAPPKGRHKKLDLL